jgi:hypothetical protein
MGRATNRMAARAGRSSSRAAAYHPARRSKRRQAITLLVVMTLALAIAIGIGVAH